MSTFRKFVLVSLVVLMVLSIAASPQPQPQKQPTAYGFRQPGYVGRN